MVTLRTCGSGGRRVWALQQDVSRTGGSGGSGDGPRVHTGIVTPHHSYFPPSIANNKFRRHHRSLVTTPLPTPPPHIPLSHYPPGENSSVLCIRVYTYTHICLRKRIYVSVLIYICVCVYMCACVGGFCDRTTYPARPRRPFTHPLYIYIYCIYVLYSLCFWVPYSQRTPLPAALSVIPNTNTFTPPPSTNVDKAQPEVAALPLVPGAVVVGGVTNPPPSPITVSSLSSAVLYCCRRQRPTSPPHYLQNSTLPSCVSKKP